MASKNKKKVVVSVTNDLVTDQRVKRSIEVLQELGFEVCFVGRQLRESLPVEQPYKTVRFKLWFRKGFLFYANYNLRLFTFLIFRKFDLYLSNDLDTLLPNFLVSRMRAKPLVYDSHEYFTGVPEIQGRPVVKGIWSFLERWLLPKANDFITVNQSIASLYYDDYGVVAEVVRNISDSQLPEVHKTRAALGIPQDVYVLINQGSGINTDRGMEEAFEALKKMDHTILMLVGKGDVLPLLKEKARLEGLQEKVLFIPPQPYLEMLQYTLNADCGLSLDKDTNLNYRYSLPNKLFDYVKCHIPVLVSDVVEVSSVVRNYDIGEVIPDHSAASICEGIETIRKKGKAFYSPGLEKAARENNWDEERQKLVEIFRKYQ
ncbi:MAG TPA: glycosyltransferase [Cryomorphaceae bacterium]|nr:glycosyltransferase [Owenweeksia sp.]HBF20220.1 glycosyltransferase [Cryomorphaceae bacterium]